MKRIIFILLSFLSCTSCMSPTHLYEGERKSKDELGHYSTTGAAGFFTSSMVYTLKIDDLDLYKTDKKVWGQVFLEPGQHTVTLSFINYDWKGIPLTEFDQKYFEGEYVVPFNVKAGYKYMPMFNLARKGEDDFFDEMCMAETPGKNGWGALKNKESIITCAKADIEVIPENFGCPPYMQEEDFCKKDRAIYPMPNG